MKNHLKYLFAGLLVSMLVLYSCVRMENTSDGDWATVNLSLNGAISSNESTPSNNSVGDARTYPTVVITAVSGSVSTVTPTTDLSDNYGQMLLPVNNFVTFTLPVGSSIRLVRAHYSGNSTLAEITSGSLKAMSIGLSEPFIIDANTTQTSVQVAMPSMSFNLKKESYVKGVYKVSLTGTKDFDHYYWGWRDSGYLDDTDYDFNLYANQDHFYFLENSNKTISFMKAIDNPMYPGYAGNSYNLSKRAFADGSFAGKEATTGSYLPIRATTGIWQDVDHNGTLASTSYSQSPQKYTIEYDENSGYPIKRIYTLMDPTNVNTPFSGSVISCGGKTITGYSWTQTFSKRIGSSFTSLDRDGHTVTNGAGIAQCSHKRTWSGTETLTIQNYTETKANYDADGTTLLAWQSTLEGVSGAAKYVRTVVLSGNIITETKKWFDVSEIEFLRTEDISTFSNILLYHRSALNSKIYSVSSGATTLTSQTDYTYANGLEVSKTYFTVTSGIATVSDTSTTSRDTQGREKSTVLKDASGDTYAETESTFDTNGRRTKYREYRYVNDVKTPACTTYFNSSGWNWDISYNTDESGLMTYTATGYCNSSSGTPGIYQESPYYKMGRTYNSMGLLTAKKSYFDSDGDGTFTLTSQQEWTYDTNGALIKTQYYIVPGGVATKVYHTAYEYDENLFRTAEKNYDEDGELSKCSSTTECTTGKATYKCASQPAGYKCYRKKTYSYYTP